MENWLSRLWADLSLKRRKTNQIIRQQLACKEVVELVTEYLEGGLLLEQRAQLEEHLADCPGCRNYIEQVRLTISMLHHLAQQPVVPETKEEPIPLRPPACLFACGIRLSAT